MPNPAEQLKHYGGILAKGLVPQLIPGMAAGLITDLLHQWNVDLSSITSDIENNHSLWQRLEEENKQQLAFAAKKIGSLDFITKEWFINAIKSDFSAIASLFLNSARAGQWLQSQIDEIKREIEAINSQPR
jgi:predicted DNA binding CopG/RHH family protein